MCFYNFLKVKFLFSRNGYRLMLKTIQEVSAQKLIDLHMNA